MKQSSIEISIIRIIIWAIGGLFVAFFCNGGAAGSVELSSGAKMCLFIYTVIFYLVFIGSLNPYGPTQSVRHTLESKPEQECDQPIERDAETEELEPQNIDYSDKYKTATLFYIAVGGIILILFYMVFYT